MTRDSLHIALAAGGTGGHLFSAIALAEVLLARHHQVSVLTDRRGARFGTNIQMRSVPATRLKGGLIGKVAGAFRLAAGVVSAAWHLKRDRCQLLVGFGGYPSVPPVLAAKLRAFRLSWSNRTRYWAGRIAVWRDGRRRWQRLFPKLKNWEPPHITLPVSLCAQPSWPRAVRRTSHRLTKAGSSCWFSAAARAPMCSQTWCRRPAPCCRAICGGACR